MSGTQPPIDITQLSSDITNLLTPTPIGVTPGYVLTAVSGTGTTWSPSVSSTLFLGHTGQASSLSDVTITTPSNGQILVYQSGTWVNQTIAGSGTVTFVGATGSTGLVVGGSPITTSGTLTFTLGTELQSLSAISADGFIQRVGGVYQGAALTSGQVTTALGFTPYNASNPSGYISGNQNITVSGDVTGNGTTAIALTLATSGVTAGAGYNTFTVNAKGLITAASTQPYITNNQTITLSGAVTGSGTTAITTTLAATSVSAGSYGNATNIPTFTVGTDGRLTAASSVTLTRPIFTTSTQGEAPASGGGTSNFLRADGTWSAPPTNSGTVTSIAAVTTGVGIAVTGSPITTTGTLSFSLGTELQGLNALSANGYVKRTGAGTYTTQAIQSSDVTTALGYTPISNVTNLNTTSPLVGGGTLSTGLTLSILAFNGSNSGYVVKNTSITGTSFLRDDGMWAAPIGGGTVTSVAASGGTTGLSFTGSPITTTGTLTLTGTLAIANGGTGQTTTANAINALLPTQTGNTGQFLTTNGTTASWAAIVSGVSSFNTRTGAVILTLSDVTTAVPNVSSFVNNVGYLTANQTITLSGDIAGSGTTAIAGILATVNANVGAFGDSTHVAAFTVNGKGLTTAASNVAIAFPVTSFNTRTGAITLSSSDVTTALGYTPGSGGGTVSSVSVTTANGISGSVATATTTPAITLTLSAITPTSVAATGTITGSNLSGTNTGDQTTITGNAGTVSAFPNRTDATSNQVVWTSGGATSALFSCAAVSIQSSTGTLSATTFSGSGASLTNIPNAALAHSSVTVTAGTGLSGGGVVALGSTITLTNAGVTAFNTRTGAVIPTSGDYSFAQISGSLVATQLPAFTGDVTSPAGSSVNTLATVNANVGTFNTLTVNGKGLITSASNTAYLTTNQTITLSGDITGSGATAIVGTLATVNANVGSFTNANITVNNKGLITAASSGAVGVTSIIGTANQITASASTGAVTLSLPTSITIATGATAGTINLGNAILQGDGTNMYLRPANTGSSLFLGSNNLNRVQIGSTGSITVSTPTSGSTLTINNIAGSYVFQTNDGTCQSFWYTNGVNGATIGTLTNQSLAVQTNNIQRMIITNNGNVGISAPTSGQALAVTAQGIGAAIFLGSVGNTTNGALAISFDTNGNQYIQGEIANTGMNLGSFQSNTSLNFVTSSNSRMQISPIGVVTILTPSSGTTLIVNGSAASSATPALTVTQNSTNLWMLPSSTAGSYNGIVGAGDTSIVGAGTGTVGTGVLTLTAWSNTNVGIKISGVANTISISGAVSIATTASGFPLTVNANSSTTGGIQIVDTSTGSTAQLSISATSDTNGANIQLVGNGATTPNKSIRVQAGIFQIINSGYTAAPLSLTDTGALTVLSTISASNFSGSSTGTNTGDQTITLTGDVTGSGTGSFATTLANTAVTAGSYTSANITVDAKGRITSATNGASGGVSSITGTASQITASASTGAVTLSLPTTINVNTSGNAATATSATTANALNTSNNYQVNSLGIGTVASGTTGEIRATNNITAYYSDMHLKNVKGPLTNALAKINSLDGFYFTANDTAQKLGYNGDIVDIGLSAQQVKIILPEIIKPAPIDPQYMTLDYAKLVPLLVEAIKELTTKNEELVTRIQQIENKRR